MRAKERWGVFETRDTRVLPWEEQRALVLLAQRENTARAFLKHAEEDKSFVLKASDRRKLEVIVREGREARGKLIQHSLPFVWSIVHKHKHRARMAEESDLASEGMLGLMHAIDLFEVERGFKFITYAANWVTAYVGRYANMNVAPVHVPNGLVDAGYQIRRRREELTRAGLDSTAVQDQLTKEYGSLAMGVQPIVNGYGVTSMDAQIGEDESATLHDVIADDSFDVEGALIDGDTEEKVARAVRSTLLSPRQRAIVERRLMGVETLAEIAVTYGLSRERIRQIETKLRPHLKKVLRAAVPEETEQRKPSRAREWGVVRVKEPTLEDREKIAKAVVAAVPAVRSVKQAANGLRVGQVVPPAETGKKPRDLRSGLVWLEDGTAEAKRDYTLSTRPEVSDAFERGERAKRAPAPRPVQEETVPFSKQADHPLTPRQQKMCDMLNAGASPKEIAVATGSPRESVYALGTHLRKLGLVTLPPKRGPNRPTGIEGMTEKRAAVKAMWDAGDSVSMISSRTGRSPAGVRDMIRTLSEEGLLTRPYASPAPPALIASIEHRAPAGNRMEAAVLLLADNVTRSTREISAAIGANEETTRLTMRRLETLGKVDRPRHGQWCAAKAVEVQKEESTMPMKKKREPKDARSSLPARHAKILALAESGLRPIEVAGKMGMTRGSTNSVITILRLKGLLPKVDRVAKVPTRRTRTTRDRAPAESDRRTQAIALLEEELAEHEALAARLRVDIQALRAG